AAHLYSPTHVLPVSAGLRPGGDVEAREEALHGAAALRVQRQQRVAALQVEVPAALARLPVAVPERAVRDEGCAVAVEHDGLEGGVLDVGVVGQVGGGEELAGDVAAVAFLEGDEKRGVGEALDV